MPLQKLGFPQDTSDGIDGEQYKQHLHVINHRISVIMPSRNLMGLVWLTAVFNGYTQGWDQSMMNNLNLMSGYVDYFQLNDTFEGLNVAFINLGSVMGGLFAGQICDNWGRKMGVAVSAAITIVAVAIQASASREAAFAVGRVLLGMAITVNGAAAPTWVMEMAHPKRRALLGGMYMAIWYFAATIVSAISIGTYTMKSTWAWRVLSIYLPCSALANLHGNGNTNDALVQAEFQEISQTLSYEKSTSSPWRTLISPTSNLRRFAIVIIPNIAAQVIGSNIVSSFVGLIFEQAGITSTHRQLVVNLGLNIFNLGLAITGSIAIEHIGRKSILLGASILMTIFLVLMAILTALYENSGNVAAGSAMTAILFFFLGSYSFAWTPLTFVYPVEIFNYTQRAKGLAVGQMACYAFGFVNQYTTPIAIISIGWRYYAINAAWNVVICGIIWWFFVETKGKALEEVNELFDGVVHADGVFIGDGKNVEAIKSVATVQESVETKNIS